VLDNLCAGIAIGLLIFIPCFLAFRRGRLGYSLGAISTMPQVVTKLNEVMELWGIPLGLVTFNVENEAAFLSAALIFALY
jgi:hypothetical protein